MPVLFGTLMTAAVMVAPMVEVASLTTMPSVNTVVQQPLEDDAEDDGEPHCTNLVCVDVVAVDTLTFSAPPVNIEPPTRNELASLSPGPVPSSDLPALDTPPVSPTPTEPTTREPIAPASPEADATASSEPPVAEAIAAPALALQTDANGLNPSYEDETPLPASGKVMYYAPGVMQRVVDYRTREQSIDACAECVGQVALLRVGDINRKVWIQLEDGTLEGPFLVVDVAHPRDVNALLARGWVVDVDWETAQRWSMKGPIAGTVLDAPPTN